MKLVKSIIAVLLLASIVYAVGQGFITAGWKGAGIVTLLLVFGGGTVKAIADTLLAPVTPRQGD